MPKGRLCSHRAVRCTLLEGVSLQSGLAATLHCHQMIGGWWIIGGPVPGDSAETTRLHLVPVMQSSEEALGRFHDSFIISLAFLLTLTVIIFTITEPPC